MNKNLTPPSSGTPNGAPYVQRYAQLIWYEGMPMTNEIQRWELIPPTEKNEFCLFAHNLEDHPLVLFHITPKRHFNSKANTGFRSAANLGVGKLTSVSYAKRSSSCLAHIGNEASEESVVFAVQFDTLQQQGIADNPLDIHVNKSEIQPCILGYCDISHGFRVS